MQHYGSNATYIVIGEISIMSEKSVKYQDPYGFLINFLFAVKVKNINNVIIYACLHLGLLTLTITDPLKQKA